MVCHLFKTEVFNSCSKYCTIIVIYGLYMQVWNFYAFLQMEKKIRDSFCCCYLLNAQFSSPKLFFSPPLALLTQQNRKKGKRKKCKNVKIRAISLFQYKKFFLLKWNCCCIEKLRKMSSTKFSLSVKQVHIVRWDELPKIFQFREFFIFASNFSLHYFLRSEQITLQ